MKTRMTLRILSPLVLAAGIFGCEDKAKYVDPNGPNTIVTLDQINIQDWNKAGQEMINSLFEHAALDSGTPGRKPVFVFDKIQNTTSLRIDTDMLTKNIGNAINNSGKAVRITTYGNESPIMNEQIARDNFENDRKKIIPDYTLSGKILEDKVQADRVRQTTYTFQMSLIDRNGLEVWGEQKQISKQGTKAQVGW